MATVQVTTVIVTYNCADTLASCLNSVLESELATTIVVVDNASSDGSVQVARSTASDALLIELPENRGFAAGCNVGIEHALERGSHFIFFLNPDATIDPACTETLVQAMNDHPEFAIVCPLILNGSTGLVWYAGAKLDLEDNEHEHLGIDESDPGISREVQRTGRPTGCAMLVRASVIKEVGPMDPTFFLYWEETEWTLRFKRAGWSVGFVPTATAAHFVSSSTGGSGQPMFEYYFNRNRLRILHENTGRKKVALTARSVRESSWRVRHAYKCDGLGGGVRIFRALSLAYLDFWRGRFGRRGNL